MLSSKYFAFVLVSVGTITTFINCFSSSLLRHQREDHCRCHCGWPEFYPDSNVKRFLVPDDKVHWSKVYREYDPPDYTSHHLNRKPYADPDIGTKGFTPLWNQEDVNNSRISSEGRYQIINGYPRNPNGRTGLRGRGKLGRWGPNHVADNVVSTWKRDAAHRVVIDPISLRPILKFIAIKGNKSNTIWSFPGGFVEPGESVDHAAIREFKEEAINSLKMSKEKVHQLDLDFQNIFKAGREILTVYMADRRNTDNAWVESTAFHFHDESGDTTGRLPLDAGDDALKVQWLEANKTINLFGCHMDILFLLVESFEAHW